MATEIHSVYESQENAPYDTLEFLGGGSHGAVHRIRHRGNGKYYAQKSIRMPHKWRSEREQMVNKIKDEARIIRRLRNNPHIVEVVATYETSSRFNPTFCILLLPIAERDLGTTLDHIDQMPKGEEKNEAIFTMRHWAACLVRAMDYMHYNRVKHKDIKPTNILVRGDQVYITDFGIARDFLLEADSESTAINVEGTRRYCPPEGLNQGRRGRASDIFSLGCCFLEMATVMTTSGQLGTLRQQNLVYAEREEHVLRWMYYLFSELAFLRRNKGEGGGLSTSTDNLILKHAPPLPALAFIMMDPTAAKRITARQLVTLISIWSQDMYCDKCRVGVPSEDPTLGVHSKFKSRENLEYPKNPAEVLKPTFALPRDWEDAKRFWLKDHMWWH
ncbi:kinase-like protein [Amniculicola lignicola CBS 123094]|uniref:non-specific serine/threonine protein kinase n=1 Tax=Amniculicola lignicola CBS 123094 TaxID=1392246 RepID=A0A6A5WRN9_9PLEO|nr:kinase-like protein [Amniculicola lignicola CBS 123094]